MSYEGLGSGWRYVGGYSRVSGLQDSWAVCGRSSAARRTSFEVMIPFTLDKTLSKQ